MTNAQTCQHRSTHLWHNPHTKKQSDQISWGSPRCPSYLQRPCQTKVSGSHAKFHKDKGNKTQPHHSSLPHPGADALHFPPRLRKCTAVWYDQEAKIKIPKDPKHVCQTDSKQEKIRQCHRMPSRAALAPH